MRTTPRTAPVRSQKNAPPRPRPAQMSQLPTQLSPELADAADVLSDQLRVHLQRLGFLLEPHTERIERLFLDRLRTLGYEPKQRTALASITPGSAACILAKHHPALKFIEQVEYAGRRL